MLTDNPPPSWFFFDLGNTVVKLAYERVIESICRNASVTRHELLELFDEPGGYRDMERGARTFMDFHEFLCNEAGYQGDLRTFQNTWSDFFDGTIPGIEDVLVRVRKKYRLAFLSNSNEIHAEVIPRRFAGLFEKDDRFIFSYRFRVAKPDPEMFHRALELVGTTAKSAVLIDDLVENVIAARGVGMRAFQFIDTPQLISDLEAEDLL
ncbi:MAG: HAD family phosphatase [Thermoanaerobaculia bacterium]